jgi:hypothetical protein
MRGALTMPLRDAPISSLHRSCAAQIVATTIDFFWWQAGDQLKYVR